ncbi:MAG: hypothetical protein V7L29_25550 [Nostoc sp.]
MTKQHQNLSYSILSMMIDEYFQTLTTSPRTTFNEKRSLYSSITKTS